MTGYPFTVKQTIFFSYAPPKAKSDPLSMWRYRVRIRSNAREKEERGRERERKREREGERERETWPGLVPNGYG